VAQWGGDGSGPYGSGSGEGQFSYPLGIAIDTNSNVYVADRNNNRVQKFNSNGAFISVVITPPDLVTSYGLFGIDSDQNIYVPSLGFNSIEEMAIRVYTPSGNLLKSWQPPAGFIAVSSRVHADTVYVLMVQENDEVSGVKIVKYSLAGNLIAEWSVPGLGYTFDIDSSGNIYYLDGLGASIYKYNANGQLLSQFGEAGVGDGQINSQDGNTESNLFIRLTVDAAGNIFVSDFVGDTDDEETTSGRIQKFSNDGTFVDSMQSELGFIFLGLSVSPEGYLYTGYTDFGSVGGVQKFTTDLEFLSEYTPETPVFSYSGPSVDSYGRIYIANFMMRSIDVLCDHDVSTNNCTGPSGDGNSGQTLTYPDSEKGTTVSLILPSDVTNPTASAVDPDTIPKDGENQFPAGLTSFQFTTTPGATKTVTLYYDLPGNPSAYTARKYKTNSQTFIDVPGATITREDYNGKSMLKLTYDITDGGILDQDGVANGTIIDPVGLATTALADTGENLLLYIASIMSLLGLGGWMATHQKSYTRNHKRKS
jgi:hypothetical protein